MASWGHPGILRCAVSRREARLAVPWLHPHDGLIQSSSGNNGLCKLDASSAINMPEHYYRARSICRIVIIPCKKYDGEPQVDIVVSTAFYYEVLDY